MNKQSQKLGKFNKNIKFSLYILIILLIIYGLDFLIYNQSQLSLRFFPKTLAKNGNQADLKTIFIDIDGISYHIKTNKQTVNQVIQQTKLNLESDAQIEPDRDQPVFNRSQIHIKQKIPVKILADNQEISVRTYPKTIDQILTTEQISLNPLDKIEPSLKTRAYKNLKIKITRIQVEELTQEQDIDFEVIEKKDSDLAWKQTKIIQPGQKGVSQTTYKITYKNGKVDEKIELSSEVIKQPEPKIIAIGTKMKLGKASKGQASWYAYTGTMACASLEHPKGTWLKVTNLENNKSVNVVVNDSGPYVPGRIIDLDKIAFEKIANLGQGVIDVKVEKIKN
ncbi:MAG: DUF348 domain-containing protein [Candidatus Moranbacteria bacterium]|nr:DUF348 domain-containing protein [Candidatus Moranbacteria bacterium]